MSEPLRSRRKLVQLGGMFLVLQDSLCLVRWPQERQASIIKALLRVRVSIITLIPPQRQWLLNSKLQLLKCFELDCWLDTKINVEVSASSKKAEALFSFTKIISLFGPL